MAENVQLRRSATDLKADCEKQKRANSELAAEMDKLKLSLKKLTAQLNQRQDDINKLAQNSKVMDQEIKDQAGYIEKLHADNSRLCTENSQLKKLQDNSMKENAQLWEQNKGLKSQLNEARGAVEELSGEMQIHKQHVDELMPENENLRRYVDDLKGKLEMAIDDNKKLVQDAEVIKAQDSVKLQSSLDENRRLKDEVNKVKINNEKLKVLFAQTVG